MNLNNLRKSIFLNIAGILSIACVFYWLRVLNVGMPLVENHDPVLGINSIYFASYLTMQSIVFSANVIVLIVLFVLGAAEFFLYRICPKTSRLSDLISKSRIQQFIFWLGISLSLLIIAFYLYFLIMIKF